MVEGDSWCLLDEMSVKWYNRFVHVHGVHFKLARRGNMASRRCKHACMTLCSCYHYILAISVL